MGEIGGRVPRLCSTPDRTPRHRGLCWGGICQHFLPGGYGKASNKSPSHPAPRHSQSSQMIRMIVLSPPPHTEPETRESLPNVLRMKFKLKMCLPRGHTSTPTPPPYPSPSHHTFPCPSQVPPTAHHRSPHLQASLPGLVGPALPECSATKPSLKPLSQR